MSPLRLFSKSPNLKSVITQAELLCQLLISHKGSQEKYFSCGRKFSCRPARRIKQDLFSPPIQHVGFVGDAEPGCRASQWGLKNPSEKTASERNEHPLNYCGSTTDAPFWPPANMIPSPYPVRPGLAFVLVQCSSALSNHRRRRNTHSVLRGRLQNSNRGAEQRKTECTGSCSASAFSVRIFGK